MSDIRVRVGQQNAVKVLSSISGSAGGKALIADNVIGGIGSIRELHVSGISTFVGISTFNSNVFIGGDLYVRDDISIDELNARNINLTGVGTIPTLNSTNASISNISNTNLNVSGVGTIPTLNSTNASISNISSTNLNVSGISTLGSSSANQLYVSGLSTFIGVGTFSGDLYVGGDLYVSDDLRFDEFTARNANITGILTVGQSIYYQSSQPFGIAYFDNNDLLVSTGTTSVAVSETNYIVSTDSSGIPTWSNVIDGGFY